MSTQISLLFITLVLFSSTVFAADVVGRWKTIDDVTGKPRSIVEISRDGKEIRGRVVELIDPTEPNPKCTSCRGEKKNAPIQGLEILWGHESSGDGTWSGGSILDPENGRTYRSTLRLVNEGNKLNVRGFIGISLLGRTQTWERQIEDAGDNQEAEDTKDNEDTEVSERASESEAGAD